MHTTSAIAITLLIIITAGICATAAAETGNPDLVVEGVSAPSEAVTGGRISLQATVRNTGDDTAPLFTACFFLSEDTVYDALDISLGRAQGASLRPASGKSVTLSASIPSRSGGPCYIIVKADCADQVREEDETNNIGTSSLIMVGSPSSSGKIPVTLPTPVPGTPAIVPTKTPSLLPTIIPGIPATIPTKTPSLLPTIIPGIPATLPTKTPSLSPTTIPGNERTPSPEPDLVITGISVPASVAPGTRAGVSITIRNQGNASASSSSLSLSLSGDRTLDPGDTSAGQVMVSPIAPGVTRTVSSSVRIPDGATGTCSLCARADANSRISESDEENNGACSMAILIHAGSSPAPDQTPALTLTSDLVAASVTSAGTGTAGGILDIGMLVRNDGTSYTRTTDAAVYLSPDQAITPADTYLGLVPVPSLNGGSSVTLNRTLSLPSTVPAATYYCGIILDHANILVEADEGNNIACSPAPVIITPAQPGDSVEAQVEDAILRYTNQERVAAGVAPLVRNGLLTTVARAHSLDMKERDFFSHTNPDRLTPFQRMDAAGYLYRSAAENIAASSSYTLASSPDEVGRHIVQDLWMNSRGHRETLISPKYTEIGIGVVYDPDKTASPYGFIATQDFGRPL
ncbi:MAG: hypothetical protein IT504_09545 [Burkholderiaceae bacterium]|nr:hypothetical protein [Burkholderiaceae bacterium]